MSCALSAERTGRNGVASSEGLTLFGDVFLKLGITLGLLSMEKHGDTGPQSEGFLFGDKHSLWHFHKFWGRRGLPVPCLVFCLKKSCFCVLSE